MRKQNSAKSFVFFSQSGCLLPLLIFLNLLFGWMFFRSKTWLLIEGILILLFIINSYVLARRISSFSFKAHEAIDVEGEVIEDRHKLK
jgi:hypothetical protein